MPWTDWIASKECLPTIRYIRSLLSKSEVKMIREAIYLGDAFLPQADMGDKDTIAPSQAGVTDTSRGLSIDDEITSELWLFLTDHLSENIIHELSVVISAGDISRIVNILKFAFINHCKDLRRKSNPYYRCYTSIREKLHKAAKTDSSLQYEADRHAAFYAFCTNTPKDSSPGFWNQHNINNFRGWETPSCGFMLNYPAKNAVPIAQFFWDESVRFLNNDGWIPIRELTNFIFAKFNVLEGLVVVDSPKGANDDREEQIDIPDSLPMPKAHQSQYERELETEARRLVLSWDERRRMIFHLRFNRDLTLMEIEDRGYNAAQYNIDQARNSILTQWNNYWLPNGLKDECVYDEDIFGYFCSAVMRFVNEEIIAV